MVRLGQNPIFNPKCCLLVSLNERITGQAIYFSTSSARLRIGQSCSIVWQRTIISISPWSELTTGNISILDQHLAWFLRACCRLALLGSSGSCPGWSWRSLIGHHLFSYWGSFLLVRLPWYQVDRTDCLCVDWTGVAPNRKMERVAFPAFIHINDLEKNWKQNFFCRCCYCCAFNLINSPVLMGKWF